MIAFLQSNVKADDTADNGSIALELRVDALSTLNSLNLTTDQLIALRDLSSDTAGTISDPPSPISSAYKTALQNLHDALLTRDPDKIDAADDKLGELGDAQDSNPDSDSDPDVTQSDSAKTKTAGFFKQLTPKQVAGFIAENADDIDDPAQVLVDALHQCRGMDSDDFDSLLQDTSEELNLLAGGVSPAKPPSIGGKANRLLRRAHNLSDDDYKSQLPSLEDEARKLVANMDPVQCIRHWMEGELADLLSNPQLGDALKEWGVPSTEPSSASEQ
jgi:hypothetical protein